MSTTQTVYFTNPTVINNIQSDVASNTANISALTGAVGVQYRQDALGKPQFLHGVASGDPSAISKLV